MRRWLQLALTVLIFTGLRPGVYVGTCDGQPVSYTVGEDGTLGVDCASISVVLTTGGISVQCDVVPEEEL